jgi:hypothetical protein
VWTTVKTWVTDERAQFEDADIKYQLELAARESMNESGIVKLSGHKDNKTDLGMFKNNHIQIISTSCMWFIAASCAFVPAVRWQY